VRPYGAVKLFRMLRLNRILNRLERKMSIKYGLWQAGAYIRSHFRST
jgi:hypothetical protein